MHNISTDKFITHVKDFIDLYLTEYNCDFMDLFWIFENHYNLPLETVNDIADISRDILDSTSYKGDYDNE